MVINRIGRSSLQMPHKSVLGALKRRIPRIWACWGDDVFEYDAADLSQIRTDQVTPGFTLTGIGGDEKVIWLCSWDSDLVYEISVSDFSIIRSAATPDTEGRGIGGNRNVIWHNDSVPDLAYELSTVDFSVVRSGATPDDLPYGIGGTTQIIWHSAPPETVGHVFELSVTDFGEIRRALSPTTAPWGIGGGASAIWHSSSTLDFIWELSVLDLSVVRAVDVGQQHAGIGGK